MHAQSTAVNGHGEVFKLLADAVQEHLHTPVDADAVRQIAGEVVNEELAKVRLPRTIEVQLPDGSVHKIEDTAHRQLPELLELVEEGHKNILLVGPAGSGKTTLAKSLKQALGLEWGFLSLSAGVTETHLLGRVLPQADGSWQYQRSKFVQIYEEGGVFLLDEIDAADANVMVAVNAALANGELCNPVTGVVHKRHANCYILAAANTWGRGGDQMYVGRNQLDAATLDRFVLATLFITYDTDLESTLATSSLSGELANELLAWVELLRGRIGNYRLRRVASTRLVVNGIKALAKGRALDKVKARYFQDWSTDEKAKVGHE